MDVLTIYLGNDALLEVKGLTDHATGEFVNDATVEATLLDSLGAEVAGQVWPITLTYVPATSGVYRATLPATLGVVANGRYTAQLTADGGIGLLARWDIDVVCRARRR